MNPVRFFCTPKTGKKRTEFLPNIPFVRLPANPLPSSSSQADEFDLRRLPRFKVGEHEGRPRLIAWPRHAAGVEDMNISRDLLRHMRMTVDGDVRLRRCDRA